MKSYRNVGGDSGISAYDDGPDWIDVKFDDGDVYRYTYASAGSRHVEMMKRLANAGNGLNSYINRNVKDNYAGKR